MHQQTRGDILVYMDDDDYYPPERVEHAVTQLTASPCLIAGSSMMHIYFASRPAGQEMVQCGPYGPYHATAATFAFKRELLLQTHYKAEDVMAEEKQFTQNYSVPMVQLDSLKTILVFSHPHNSLSKERMLENPAMYRVQPSTKTLDDFRLTEGQRQFYTHDMPLQLALYSPGRPELKPEIMEECNKVVQRVEQRQKQMQQQQTNLMQEIQALKAQLVQKDRIIQELMKRLSEERQTNQTNQNLNTKNPMAT